jgi:DNA-binding NtrC family response regulator
VAHEINNPLTCVLTNSSLLLEDISVPAYHLLAKMQAQTGKKVSTISDASLKLLEQYDWPGNVRQIESTIERAVICCDGTIIEPHHLPMAVTRAGLPAPYPVPQNNQEFLTLKLKYSAMRIVAIALRNADRTCLRLIALRMK